MVNPDISIKFVNAGKTIIHTIGNGDNKSVIYSVYGKDVADNILNVDYTYEDIKVTGVIGKPEIARSNRANQLFFVNKRYIKDKVLTSSAERGYKDLLPAGKYGFLILNVEIDPAKVDVNVHPAKLEVRFEEEGKVFKAVYHAIQDTLLNSEIIKDSSKKDVEYIKPKDYSKEQDRKVEINIPKDRPWEQKSSIEKLESINPTFGALFKKIVENTKSDINSNIKKEENTKSVDEEESKEALDTIDSEVQEEKISEMPTDVATVNSENNEDVEKNLGLEENNVIEDDFEAVEKDTEQDEDNNAENIIEAVLKNAQEMDYFDDSYKVLGLENKNSENEKNQEENIDNNQNNNETEEVNNDFDEATIEKETEEKLEEENEDEILEEQVAEEPKEKDISSENMENIIEKINELKETKMNPDDSNFDEMYAKMFGILPKKEVEEKVEEQEEEDDTYKIDENDLVPTENISIFEYDEYKSIPTYKYIGLAFNEYLIIEIDREMYIIDGQSAKERIIYEKIKKNYYSNGPKESQIMLLPDIINLTYKQMLIAKDNMQLFENAGFTLEEFGENTIKVSGVPNICIDLDTKELFIETLDEINTVARTAKKEIEEKFIWTLACKVAEKQDGKLEKDEIDNMVQELLKLDNPFSGEQGNIIAIKMSKMDIEKKFSRRK